MATLHGSFQNIARAISAYSDQEYTDAVRIAGSALVGTDARINGNAEDFYGSIRWDKTLGDLSYDGTGTNKTQINQATETSTEGVVTNMATDIAEYIKTYRTMGANQYNVTSVITQRDGAIAKVARDFGVTRARDADASLISVFKGVITAELKLADDGATAGQNSADTLDDARGFFVDLNNLTGAATPGTTGTAKLVDTSKTGGKAAAGIFQASAYGYADLEPDFMYLVIQPSVFLDLKTSNLIDEDHVVDGNINFNTILSGAYRLIVTRSSFGDHATAARVNTKSTKTSLLVLPGAISMSAVSVTNPVAFDRDESVGGGAGLQELWYRWGNVYHPRGYSWTGAKTAFASNGNFEASGAWTRKETVGNLGILPIFHA